MPFVTAAGIAATGTALGGIGQLVGAFGGGGTTVSGFELPPEFELQLVETAETNLREITQDLDKAKNLELAFNERIDTLAGLVEGTIPSQEGLMQLRNSAFKIAQNFGGSTEELISSGFLEADDVEDLQRLEALETEEGIRDPRLENQLADERARLEQDLSRQGASPAVRAQALAQFDRRAEESRFTRGEELRTGRFERIRGRIGLRSGLREAGFGRAVAGQQVLTQQLGAAREGIAALGGLAERRLQAGGAVLEARRGLRGERIGISKTLGEFDISGRTRDLLRAGQIGPGSVEAQLAARQGRIAVAPGAPTGASGTPATGAPATGKTVQTDTIQNILQGLDPSQRRQVEDTLQFTGRRTNEDLLRAKARFEDPSFRREQRDFTPVQKAKRAIVLEEIRRRGL